MTALRSEEYQKCDCLFYFTIWKKILYGIYKAYVLESVKAWVLVLVLGHCSGLISHVSLVPCYQATHIKSENRNSCL